MKKLLFTISCIILLLSITSCGAQEQLPKPHIKLVAEFKTEMKEYAAVFKYLKEVTSSSIKGTSSNFESRDAETLFADMMIDFYLSGKWNGLPIEFEGHKVSLGKRGELIIDGFLSYPSKFHCQTTLDFPYPFKDGTADSFNTVCIPGKGTYVLLDEVYFKYLRGERIDLPGGTLNWKEGEGVDVDYGHAYLHYCERYDKMFLTTPMLELDDGSGVPTLKPCGPYYLYIFPDYDVSEIEFVGRAKEYNCDEDGFSYVDENNIYWEYCKKDGKYFFKKVAQIFE